MSSTHFFFLTILVWCNTITYHCVYPIKFLIPVFPHHCLIDGNIRFLPDTFDSAMLYSISKFENRSITNVIYATHIIRLVTNLIHYLHGNVSPWDYPMLWVEE